MKWLRRRVSDHFFVIDSFYGGAASLSGREDARPHFVQKLLFERFGQQPETPCRTRAHRLNLHFFDNLSFQPGLCVYLLYDFCSVLLFGFWFCLLFRPGEQSQATTSAGLGTRVPFGTSGLQPQSRSSAWDSSPQSRPVLAFGLGLQSQSRPSAGTVKAQSHSVACMGLPRRGCDIDFDQNASKTECI